MDWPMHILFLLISVSGLFKLCTCVSYSNLETAQRFEMCVVTELSQSTHFTEQEKWKMSKIVKATDVRMRRMGVDPTSDSNVRTMLRLFSAALANLVFDDENLIKRCDRKQNYSTALELCSSSLTESTSAELISEVSRIFASMENQISIKNSNNEETTIPKNLWDQRMASEDTKTKKRQKRAPQFSEGFALNPPLDPIIAGVLISSPVFGGTFKSGLSKQDSANYARSMVAAALKDYDYSMTRVAMNEVTNAISSLMFMPQTVDYAFAISGSINKVLSARGLASFVDGVSIGNALISKLQEMTEKQNPMFPLPSSSGWESDIRITSQLNIAPPVQISPSWDMPPPPQFQFDPTIKQDFRPQMFAVSGSRYPLNPSFAPDPIAPLPGFGSDSFSFENPGMSSFSENIPFGTMASSTVSQSAWPPSPFPVDQTFGQKSTFPNQPTTDERIPFRFDLSGTQDFSSASFTDQFPAQQPGLLNQPASQYQQTFDGFSSGDSRVPPIPREDSSPFDQTLIQSENPEQAPIPSMGEALKREEITYPSDDFKATSGSQTTLYQPKEDISKSGETTDPYIMDAISVIYSTLDLSDEFASVFSREISPDDAASLATAMTKFSLSQYNPTVAANIESQVGNAVFSVPVNSSPGDYARAIADSFIKAINQSGLLNSVNSKSMADSLIAGLRREINNRTTSADSSTIIQNAKSDETPIPLNGGETKAFADASMSFLSDGSAQEANQQSPKNEPNSNTEVSSSNSSLIAAVTFQRESTSSGQSNSNKDLNPDHSLEIPLEAGPFVSGTQSEQPINKASNLNTALTVVSSETSPLEIIAESPANTKLSKIPDLTEAVEASTSNKVAKNPQENVELFMDEVESSLKMLNQTSELMQQQNIQTTEQATSTTFTETTKMGEFVPVTPPSLNSKPAELDTENTGQSSVDTKVELQPSFQATTLPLEKTSTEPENSEIIAEKPTEGDTQLNKEASLYADKVTSIASSAIAYIRSGNLNLDELCGKLNILAFVVEIPPVDNCAEIAMIDYLLNVLNAVVSNLRRN